MQRYLHWALKHGSRCERGCVAAHWHLTCSRCDGTWPSPSDNPLRPVGVYFDNVARIADSKAWFKCLNDALQLYGAC